MKKYIASILLATSALGLQAQGLDENVEDRLTRFFSEYQPAQARIGTCKLDSFVITSAADTPSSL